jgi:hypothetical protein
MAQFEPGTNETASPTAEPQIPMMLVGSGAVRGARLIVGSLSLAVSLASWVAWIGWRVANLGAHPVAIGLYLIELLGVAAGAAVAVRLAMSGPGRTVYENDRRESYRYAFAVADHVGRTRSVDLHRDVRVAMRAAPHASPTMTDMAMGSVLTEGPRRLALVLTVTLALVLGVAPMPMPPAWAMIAALVSAGTMSCAHVVFGRGRIRFGDRTRWAFSAMGEVLSPADREGLAPRRWLGTVATVVVVNLAIALRGTSDRWTHGLSPMSHDDRLVTMLLACGVVIGALFTLRTMAAPSFPDAHLVSRRLEERTARQSALGGAVCIGLVGLLAGVLPGSVDAADEPPVGIVQITEHEAPSTVPLERFADG